MTIDVVTARPEPGQPPVNGAATGSTWVTVLFAATSFVGAGLLFVVQPLIARLVLPYFGGSATVWSTSSLFFQVLLLVAYLYVHISTVRLGRRQQPLLHLAVLLLPLVVLPVALPDTLRPDPSSSPVVWLLLTLAMTIGLPFVVIATTGPLLQRWYSWTANPRADDPYFLFATSNLGSFGGLLAYPFIVEPLLTLDQQRVWWSWGFVGFIALMFLCGVAARIGQRAESVVIVPLPGGEQQDSGRKSRPRTRLVLTWLGLAFLPSTLMLGVTSHISTDVAAIPLMWVVPLAIYLATFVAAFARQERAVPVAWFRASALFALLAAVAFVASGGLPVWAMVAIDLGLLLTAAFAAHARLAGLRPETGHLTVFYLVVAAGGALGGLLNGVIAPVVFNWVWEYPIAVALAALLGVGHGVPLSRFLSRRYHRVFVLFIEATLGVSVMVLTLLALVRLEGRMLALPVAGLVAVMGGWLISRRPAATALAVSFMVVLPLLIGDPVLHRDRTFYGSYAVRQGEGVRTFTHGTTVHGQQSLGEDRSEPRTYYARSGPVGSAFRALDDPQSVGVVGLGVGTIAAYGQPGQSMTFFEIDPAVVDVASDPELFTFLADSPADISHVVGDGRLMLAEQAEGSFDVLFLDAFTSDAIPVHLLTAEAFDTYAGAIMDEGLLMVHISNRIFDLEPVVTAAADHIGWHAAVGYVDTDVDTGGTATQWVALAADRGVIERLTADDEMWRVPDDRRLAWTDDFSSVLTALR